jgi:hypothetical protein
LFQSEQLFKALHINKKNFICHFKIVNLVGTFPTIKKHTPMKKLLSLLTLQTLVILSLHAQPVSDYSYKLDNGINIRTEHCWSQVWVQQSYAALTASDKSPLAVNIRTLGDLITGSTFKLLSSGKEIKVQGAAPGTYELKLVFKLSGKPGTLSFVIGNILIKSKTKTSLAVTLYDYQILVAETAASAKGLASFETKVNWSKTAIAQDIYVAIPSFFAKGKHDKPITADQIASKTSGSIKPGTYDVLLSIGISGQAHNIWLENFTLKPDIKYKISTNLNAGEISYSGSNKDMSTMKLYPAGTANTQTSSPAPNKSIEIISYDNLRTANCCSPGTYDVLLGIKNGTKYEWRKNIIIQTGTKTEVK